MGARVVYLHDTREACELLRGLSALQPGSADRVQKITESAAVHDARSEREIFTIPEKMSCSICDMIFQERELQVAHFQGDWHRYNVKQSVRGRPALPELHFHQLNDDVSSISGSESGSESDVTSALASDPEDTEGGRTEGRPRNARLYLRNSEGHVVSLFRALIASKRNEPESEQQLVSMVTALPRKLKWLVVMLAGGHFAAAVFDGSRVVVHKTFHRYVVRAKRGTVQSARDSQGSAPKSVGAFLRRHHEAALTQDIKSLLEEWAEHVTSCDRIFLRATGTTRQTFFNKKAPLLDKRDPRLAAIPFLTRRPTYSEVRRVQQSLAAIHCHGLESEFTMSPKQKQRPETSTSGSTVAATQVEATSHQSVTSQQQESQQEVTSLPQGSKSNRRNRRKKEVPKAKKYLDAPNSPGDDSSASDGDVIELVALATQVELSELQQFEVNVKKARRKKKKGAGQQGAKEQEGAGEATREEVQEEDPDPYTCSVDVWCGLRNELYTAVKTGSADLLRAHLAEHAQRCTQAQIPTELGVNGALNAAGFRLLHLACLHGNPQCARILLQHGADPTLRDGAGSVAYTVARDRATRLELRAYRAEFPDRHVYNAAQIPLPPTEEEQAEKRARDAEKHRVKSAQLKERKAAGRRAREEEAERQRFLQLSDREKRALAAEKRLLAQAQQQGNAPTTLRYCRDLRRLFLGFQGRECSLCRCFECAADMTGRVPFEYSDYRFCTPACLQAHRKHAQARR